MNNLNFINKVLIVGLGSIGKRHLRIIRESLPHVEILVFRHQPATLVPVFADKVTSSMTEVIDFMPDVAVICNPAPIHLSHAYQLIKNVSETKAFY